jgi:glycosyltransferase involved in cell wall biosynthesis
VPTSLNTSPKLISLVIPTYNRPAALDRVLAACVDQTDLAFEIVIADDGSTPETTTLIDSWRTRCPAPLTHVWQPDAGFRAAQARNKATAQARGDYVVFLDGDCVPQRNFVARHRALARPNCIVTGSRILLSETLTRNIEAEQHNIHREGFAYWLRQRIGGNVNKCLPLLGLPADLSARKITRFTWKSIKSCNLAVWKCDLERVDGFDNTFTGWGHEDADLVARLHNAGVGRVRGFFATEVFHLWHRENPRGRESVNYARVVERLASGQIQAESGIAACRDDPQTVVRR